MKVEFEVVDRSNQVEAQGKSLSAIAISLAQNTKHFQLAKNMFNQNSLTSQSAISLLFFLCQSMIFGFLERGLAVSVKFCQALITSIRQNTDVLGNFSLIILEELKVMFTSMRKGSCYNFGSLLVGNQLCFLSVAFLFAAVMPFLAFFGRSIGCSLTSTSTTSKRVSLG